MTKISNNECVKEGKGQVTFLSPIWRGRGGGGQKFRCDWEVVKFFKSYENVPRLPHSHLIRDLHVPPEHFRKHLKRNKALGPDDLGSSFLLDICDKIARPLSIIFSLILQLKQVPSDWKHANVKPLYKKGDKFDPGNYHPTTG